MIKLMSILGRTILTNDIQELLISLKHIHRNVNSILYFRAL